MSSSKKASLLCCVAMALMACGENDPAAPEEKNLDIDFANAERVGLAVFQSTVLAFFRNVMFDVLDPNDSPIVSNERICSDGGKAIYSFSGFPNETLGGQTLSFGDVSFGTGSGDVYEARVGDRFQIEYRGCQENELILNGSISGQYTMVEGNTTFAPRSDIACLAVEIEQEAERLADPDNADLEVNCHKYRRDILLSFNSFQFNDPELGLLFTFNGNGVKLEEEMRQRSTLFAPIESRIEDAEFSVRIQQGENGSISLNPIAGTDEFEFVQTNGQDDVYDFRDYSLSRTIDETPGTDGLRYDFSGLVTSDRRFFPNQTFTGASNEFFGTVLVATDRESVKGRTTDHIPTIGGRILISGRVLENTRLIWEGEQLQLPTACVGDTTTDGFADNIFTVDTTISRLLDFDFVVAEDAIDPNCEI